MEATELILPYAGIEIERLVKQYYPDMSTRLLSIALGVSISRLHQIASSIGSKKSPEFKRKEAKRLSLAGQTFRFKKGQIPPNKGKPMSKEVYEKVKPTMFKKGNMPQNTKYDGHLSIRTDKRAGRSYIYVRVSLGKYRELHRVMWEQANGKIPKGFNVVFKDNNTSNVRLENLELVSNAELMARNTIQRYPNELKSLIKLLSKLRKEIRNGEELNG